MTEARPLLNSSAIAALVSSIVDSSSVTYHNSTLLGGLSAILNGTYLNSTSTNGTTSTASASQPTTSTSMAIPPRPLATAPGAHLGPPYPPQVQQIGGIPRPMLDGTITAVILFIYFIAILKLVSAFKMSRRNGYVFPLSILVLVFSLIRVITLTLRMAWSTHQHNLRLGLTAVIFVNAGTIILYVLNLILTYRLVRQRHPLLVRKLPVKVFSRVIIPTIIITIILLIISIIQSSYTLDQHIHSIDRKLQEYGVTYFAFIAFLPILILSICFTFPRIPISSSSSKKPRYHEAVGAAIVVLASVLLTFRAAFMASNIWKPQTPLKVKTPWYLSKTVFYCVVLVPELLVVFIFAASNIDHRFNSPSRIGTANADRESNTWPRENDPDAQLPQGESKSTLELLGKGPRPQMKPLMTAVRPGALSPIPVSPESPPEHGLFLDLPKLKGDHAKMDPGKEDFMTAAAPSGQKSLAGVVLDEKGRFKTISMPDGSEKFHRLHPGFDGLEDAGRFTNLSGDTFAASEKWDFPVTPGGSDLTRNLSPLVWDNVSAERLRRWNAETCETLASGHDVAGKPSPEQWTSMQFQQHAHNLTPVIWEEDIAESSGT